jgi:glycosyltransferase involved in cell wall biosynthesis
MNKTIKIAIDVSPLSDGNSIRGVGYYTDRLVKALQFEVNQNKKFSNFEICLVKNKDEIDSSFHLIHYPFFDPFKLTLPKKEKIPIIVTVHDLIPIQFTENFPVGIKGSLKWLCQKHRLKKVNQIITVSDYSKKIINKIVNFPDQRIHVTYEAADPFFKKITDDKLKGKIKKKYKLPDKFILYVGDVNWNKNIPGLVKACESLNYNLVIVGSAATRTNVINHPWNKDLLWLQERSKNSKTLYLTGFVPDLDLAVIYNLATIYCQPSFAEGFGLPLIQAIQSGCPVIYSNQTSMPEIMKDNGISFNPYLKYSLKEALKSLYNDKKLLNFYSKKGIEYSKSFDWKYTAQKTLSVYKLALSNEKK